MPVMDTAPPGYDIGSEIARTARAIVYEGVERSTGKPVALKLVQNDACGHREIAMLKRVHSTSRAVHVMRCIGSYEDDYDLWIILERFDHPLNNLNARKMTPLALMTIALDTAKGLVEMERAGVVDDDVKPENIAFKSGSGRVAHVDLGGARLAGSPPKEYTPGFVAPEIKAGIPSGTSPCYGWARTMEFVAYGKFDIGPDYWLCDLVPWIGEAFASLVAECCLDDPRARPPAPELYRRVKQTTNDRTRCSRCNAVLFRDGACVQCG